MWKEKIAITEKLNLLSVKLNGGTYAPVFKTDMNKIDTIRNREELPRAKVATLTIEINFIPRSTSMKIHKEECWVFKLIFIFVEKDNFIPLDNPSHSVLAP